MKFISKSNKSYWIDVLIQSAGVTGAQIISVLSMPILSRIYTPEDFGALSLFVQYSVILGVLSTFRFEHLVMLMKTQRQTYQMQQFVLSLSLLGFVFYSSVFYFIKDYEPFSGAMSSIAYWYILLPLAAVLPSIANCFQAMVQKIQDYKNSGISEVLNKLNYFLFAFFGVYLLEGVLSLIIAIYVGFASKAFWLARSINLMGKYRLSVCQFGFRKIWPRIQPFSKLALSSSVAQLLQSFTVLLPLFYINKSFGEIILGQFVLVQASLSLPSIVIGTSIGQVYYERASKYWAQNQTFRHLWVETEKKLFFFGCIIYFGVFLVSEWMYPFIFGDQWLLAGRIATILSLSAFFSFISTPLDKASLIVGAVRYIPVWHGLRLGTTALLLFISEKMSLSFEEFLWGLVFQMTALYCLDLFVQFGFSGKVPKTSTK